METSEPSVGAIETHLSEVFLGHDRVFKRLKPVSLPFIDLSTSQRRCAAAAEEFRQNHAISPSVYLGLADVVEDGTVTDRLIVMRRLRAMDELTHQLDRPDVDDVLRATARRVAQLHMDAPALTGDAATPAGADALARNWEDNFDALAPFVGTIIERDSYQQVVSLVRSWLAGRSHLFEERIADGWVREGHGDLRAEHVYCTTDGVELIDCVAFDRNLRVADILSDVAFLAMDLERLSGREASHRLMQAWGEFTGEHHPSPLAHFYVAYRAHVRAKVAAIRASQGDSHAAAEASRYHERCLEHLRFAAIRVVMVGGGPGTGKSTVASGVAQAIGGAWLRADEVRKDLAGVAHDEHAFAEPDGGIYSPDMSERTRGELRRQAGELLRRGISVVLDSTWQADADRVAVRDLADAAGAELTELRCDLPPAIAKERIARRLASLYEPSDATPDLVDAIGERFDPWPEAATIDTSTSIETSIAAALQAILRQGESLRPSRLAADDERAASRSHPAGPVIRIDEQTTRLRESLLIVGGLPDPAQNV